MDYYKNYETIDSVSIPSLHCEFMSDCAKLNSHMRALDYPLANNHLTHISGKKKKATVSSRTIAYKF